MSEPKPEYKTKAPRPDQIKITATKPTIKELKEYRAAWLKEGEESKILNDLILIAKTLGVTGELKRPGRPAMKIFRFSGGDNDYALFHDTVWTTHVRSLYDVDYYTWDCILLRENGEPKKEDYTGKMLVSYVKCRKKEGVNTGGNRIADMIENSIFLPGDWELYVGAHATVANDKLAKSKKEKTKIDRSKLLDNMGFVKEGQS